MATLGELGEFPLQLYGFIALLSFWHRVSLMDERTLVKQALNLITNDDTFNFEWTATVKFLLSYLGINEYYLNPNITKTDTFTSMCKMKMKEKISQEWLTEISGDNREGNEGKLRFYKLFKRSFELEPYLTHIKN